MDTKDIQTQNNNHTKSCPMWGLSPQQSAETNRAMEST